MLDVGAMFLYSFLSYNRCRLAANDESKEKNQQTKVRYWL